MKQATCLIFTILICTLPGHAIGSDTWQRAGEIRARIKAPQFPARDFLITSHGAIAGGTHDVTQAISRAIAACHESGGGRVVVPAGLWHTGAIHLRSNVNLHVEEGATLLFDTDPKAYLPVVLTRWEGTECMNYSPLIYALDQENIAITGRGTLDGMASDENWWKWGRRDEKRNSLSTPDAQALVRSVDLGLPVADRLYGEGHFLRPNFVQFYRCRNVLLEGVRIRRSPMWIVHPVLCTNVTIRSLDIQSHGRNNDGCDPESCRDVLIENCTFDTGDDCIAIKSGKDDDGRRIGVASENILIRNCVMKDGHGGVVIGSEISGDCRDVFIEDCTMDSPNQQRAFRFKSNARRGGVIENIYARNVRIGAVTEAIITIDFLYEVGAAGTHRPRLRNVQFENVVSKSSPRVFYVAGFEGAMIDDLKLVHCQFAGLEANDLIEHAGKITLENVTLLPKVKPEMLSSRRSVVP